MLKTFTISWKSYLTLGLLAWLTACGVAAPASGSETAPASTPVATLSTPTSTTVSSPAATASSLPTPSILPTFSATPLSTLTPITAPSPSSQPALPPIPSPSPTTQSLPSPSTPPSTPVRGPGTSLPTPSSPPSARTGSGIEGRTVIGPVCPVARANQPCPDRPYPATVTILGVGDRPVAQAHSDAHGQFRVDLPAGTYTLVPLSPDKYPRPPQPQSVTVAATGYVSVTLTYDSGIR